MNRQLMVEKMKQTLDFLTRKHLLGAAVLAVFAGMAGVIMATGPESEPQPREEKAWPVSVQAIEPGSISPTLIAYGRVESRQMANLKTSITALVDEMVVSEGDWVEKGDLLIRLEDAELRLALNMASAERTSRIAQLETARTEYELASSVTAHHEELKKIADAKLARHLELYTNNMVSNGVVDEVRREASERAITLQRHYADLKVLPRTIQQREARVAEADALVEKAEFDLAQTELRAPFSGRVIETLVAPGDRSVPGVALLRVANYEGLEVRTSIPGELGYRIRQSLDAGEAISAVGELDNRTIALHLDRLSGDVKSGQSGIDAFFVAGSGEHLDIGRVVDLKITLPVEHDVIALPVQSIYERGRVYRVNDTRLEGLDIERVGDHVDNEGNYFILVRSDKLTAGDRMITTQLPRAITGLLVDPIDAGRFDEAIAGDIPTKAGG